MKVTRRAIVVGMVLAGAACTSPTVVPPTSAPAVAPTTSTAATITTTTIDTREGDPACLRRAQFGDPGESFYILPFPPGARYKVLQSYCNPAGGHRNQLAYDFNMPIGAEVVAARGGLVLDLRQDSPDDGRGDGEHNYVYLQHDDGTVAFYAHLQQDRVFVELGDTVEAGEVIALSGNSGLSSTPHLHFGVYRSFPQEGQDVPVNFRNTDYPLDPWGDSAKAGYIKLTRIPAYLRERVTRAVRPPSSAPPAAGRSDRPTVSTPSEAAVAPAAGTPTPRWPARSTVWRR